MSTSSHHKRWPHVPLGEVTERITKGTTPTTVGGKFTEEGISFLKVESIDANGRLDPSRVAYIDDESDELLARSRLREHDVLFSIAGAIGRTYLVQGNVLPANVNQALAIVRPDPKKLFPPFCYYALRDVDFQSEAQGRVVQCAQANVNLKQLGLSALPLPPINKQKEIADILTAYDDLMENNRRRMALLEESARQLYREWFVRLRYPGHARVRLKDGLPAGWSRGPLEPHAAFLKRGIAPHYDDDAEGLVINQKCIRDGRVNLDLARRQSREFAQARQIQIGDVLINSTGEGTLGRVAQVKSPVENCTVDTHVTIVRPQPDVPVHYFGLCLMDWEPQLSTMGRGSTNQTELSPAAIGACEILMPAGSVVDRFEAYAAPLYSQVTNLVLQNQKLRAARDHLLPRLLSGALAV